MDQKDFVRERKFKSQAMWSNMLQLDGDIIMKGVPNRYSNSIGYNDGDSELMNDHGPSVVKIGS